MPKSKRNETQHEQGERFKKAVQEMVDAGELSPTEAEDALDALVRKSTTKPSG